MANVSPSTSLDHLVVAARSLDEGRAWCRETLGVEAAGGGQHAGLATHNTLLRLGEADERCYLEIIAIDPTAGAPAVPRWFGLDTAAVQRDIAHGPRLVAWVARCAGGADAIERLSATAGYAANVVRPAARGDFRWRFSFTADGERVAGGVLPHLIQWDVSEHPCDRMPESGVRLLSLLLGAPDPQATTSVLASMVFQSGAVHVGQSATPHLVATLHSPRGVVTLD